MKKYAVAIVNFFDNELHLSFVESNKGWKDALNIAHPSDEDNDGWDWLSDDYNAAQQDVFDGDRAFAVKEIK